MREGPFILAAVALISSAAGHSGTDRQTRRVFENYTECAAKLHPKDAAAVVLSTAQTDEIMKSHPALLTPNCLDSGQLVMPGSDFLRYGLAEALVRREFANGLPFDIAHAAPVAHTDFRESDYLPKPGKKLGARELSKLQEQRTQAIAVRTLSIYSECVVRANPAAALRLELSASNSAQEAEAFAAMNNGLSSCLPTGETISLDKTALRGALAMSLYRLAHNPPASLALPPR